MPKQKCLAMWVINGVDVPCPNKNTDNKFSLGFCHACYQWHKPHVDAGEYTWESVGALPKGESRRRTRKTPAVKVGRLNESNQAARRAMKRTRNALREKK